MRVVDCLKNHPEAAIEAARILESGGLVALPTETVYGLAAHIHFHEALESIYTLKQRPHSDPLIVHIFDASWIDQIASPNSSQLGIANALADAFWPGPLTLVMESSEQVHPLIRANGTTVAMRSPAHPFFRAVLQKVGAGIAAPSANVFGHISPTCAAHVLAEFPKSDLTVFDGGPSEVGIESTVVRIERDGGVHVLRPGVITAQDLMIALAQRNLPSQGVRLPSRRERLRTTDEDLVQVSPGLAIRHYAPNIPTYVLDLEENGDEATGIRSPNTIKLCLEREVVEVDLATVVVIDFGPPNVTMLQLQKKLKGYINPAPSGDLALFTRELFSALRAAESLDGTAVILIHFSCNEDDRWANAIRDRIYRSASGKVATISG